MYAHYWRVGAIPTKRVYRLSDNIGRSSLHLDICREEMLRLREGES